MPLPLLAAIVIGALTAGYFLYGKLIARQYRLDDTRRCPAEEFNDGNDYVSTEGLGLPGQWWSAYDTDLGDATSGRYLWNGIWRRDFTRGIVLLNEPGGTTKTLSLGGTFTTTSGQLVSSVTLGASRGAVLKAA